MIDENKKNVPLLCSVRFLMTFLLFLVVTIQFTHKTDISVGVLCMINHTAIGSNSSIVPEDLNNTNGVKCFFQNRTSSKSEDGPFEWNKSKQEFLLASYFYGYLISQILGGWLSLKYGSKKILCISVFFGSVGTILVPVCAKNGFYLLIVCRFLTGFVEGMMWPAITNVWTHWAPNHERSRLIGLVSAGSNVGTVTGFSLGGYLCIHGFDGGWPSIFYIFGAFGLVWCVIWLLLASDSPSTHRLIKQDEKEYIANNIREEHNEIQFIKIWKLIFTSKKCIVLFIHHFCLTWTMILFLTNAPTYVKEVLKFDIQSNGVLSAVPYIVVSFITTLSGIVSDKLIESKKIPTNIVRKVFSVLALALSAGAILSLSFIHCDRPYLGVALLTIGIGTSGLATGGYIVTFNDIVGQYAGFTFSISNTIAQTTGIIVPYTVAAITKNQTQEEWSVVFILSAGILLFGAVMSALFGSIEAEPWAVKDKKQTNSIQDDRYIVNDNYFY